MMKCKICGKEFYAIIEEHYIARDEKEICLSTLYSSQEVMEYDAFDCPKCGCQVIAQPRKRRVNMSNAEA